MSHKTPRYVIERGMVSLRRARHFSLFWVRCPCSMRLFIAVSLPSIIREKLAEFSRDIAGKIPSQHAEFSWVKSENFHITLKFLGECEQDQIPALKDAILEAGERSSAFPCRFGPLGCF